MDNKDIIELTNKLYKKTLLFPKKEPLRYKIREIGNRVLEGITALEVFHTSEQGHDFLPVDNSENESLIFSLKRDLDIIISYFEVVKYQNWISYFEALEIQDKYGKIKSNLEDELSRIQPTQTESLFKPFKPEKNKDLDERKKKILSFLKEKNQAQVWQVKEFLPDVSKRTLRRDFEYLLKQGLVKRIGERNNTFYKLS